MHFRRLLPEPGTVAVDELLDGLELGAAGAPRERPRVLVNFVASADGRATFQGRSGPLGDDGDRAIFHGLRERVDAVLAGTGTIRAERYGRMIADERRRARRVARGLSPEPLACLITRSGGLDTSVPLFAEPEARVLVLSGAAIETSALAARVEVLELEPGAVTPATLLARLRADYGVSSLLCEGGPTLFAAMLAERVVDELFLTIAPRLTGGGAGPAITAGPELPEPQAVEPAWLLERNRSLYVRYRLSCRDWAEDSG